MTTEDARFPLIKRSEKAEIALSLIAEELKSRKFFEALRRAGIDDCYLQPHLDGLILRHVGIDDGMDATFELYSKILDKRCKNIHGRKSAVKQALKVYNDLMVIKQCFL